MRPDGILRGCATPSESGSWKLNRIPLASADHGHRFLITATSLFPMTQATFLKLFAVCCSLLLSLSGLASGQVIVTNSQVAYTYQQSASNSFVPVSPLVSEVPDSRLAFAPNSFVAQASSGSGIVSALTNSVLTVDMRSASGKWFSGNAVVVDLFGSYSLSAPFSTSEAFASVTGNYTLYLDEVNDIAFSSPPPLAGSFSFAPTNVFSLAGPGAAAGGNWSSSLTLDINTIKAHFGIGSSSNVTGLRLQYSQTLSSAGKDGGTGTANLLNVNITNQVVPEPSTYALLVLAAAGVGVAALRRRKRSSVE